MIQVRCPICGKEVSGEAGKPTPESPFCSPRCRLIDLGRWLGEDYRITAEEDGSPPEDCTEESESP